MDPRNKLFPEFIGQGRRFVTRFEQNLRDTADYCTKPYPIYEYFALVLALGIVRKVS
jgi:hypothetical protein